MKLIDAARLARDSYSPDRLPGLTLSLTARGAEAHLLSDGTLVIPGTNNPKDWKKFNLQLVHSKGRHAGWPDQVNSQIARASWLFGFAVFAATIRNGLGMRKPARVIGHSLGGGGAQVLGLHYGVPTITFNAPAPRVGAAVLLGEAAILNLWHVADPAATLWGKASRVRHLGRRQPLAGKVAGGNPHPMTAFAPLIEATVDKGLLPASWPA